MLQEREKKEDFNHSIRTNPAALPFEWLVISSCALTYGNMIDAYLWGINIEYQYALNNYFAFCLMPTP